MACVAGCAGAFRPVGIDPSHALIRPPRQYGKLHVAHGGIAARQARHPHHRAVAGVAGGGVGEGVRRILDIVSDDGSPLDDPDVDPELRAEILDAVSSWVPLLALRFSRAF